MVEPLLPAATGVGDRGVRDEVSTTLLGASVDTRVGPYHWSVHPVDQPAAVVEFPAGTSHVDVVTVVDVTGVRHGVGEVAARHRRLVELLGRAVDEVAEAGMHLPGRADLRSVRAAAVVDADLRAVVDAVHEIGQFCFTRWSRGVLDTIWVPTEGTVTMDRRHAMTIRTQARG